MNGLAALVGLSPRADADARLYGVTIGIVTNTKDPEQLGRVRVKLPWLSEEIEGPWARVVAPMAGKRRGMFFPFEVDDEVLVAFEHGQIEFPYVLGGLWNSSDSPPEANANGQNNLRMIKSRSGHSVTFDDTTGNERIEIKDNTGENSIVLDSAQKTVTISAAADVILTAPNGNLKLSGVSVEIASKAGMELRARGQLTIKGMTVDIN